MVEENTTDRQNLRSFDGVGPSLLGLFWLGGPITTAMGEVSSSAAFLGYFAPICVAIVFFCAWVFVSARRRRRLYRHHYGDIETSRHPVILACVVEERFPKVKYKVWQENKDTANKEEGKTEASTDHQDDNRDNLAVASEDPSAIGPRINVISPSHGTPPASPCTSEGYEQAGLSADDTGKMCPICIDQFDGDDDIRELTCGHIFHASCLDPWITKRRASCPMCKMFFGAPRSSRCHFPRPAAPEAVLIRGDLYSRAF
ncbi:hypothetical protein BO71DRAFT_12931 [Aspergillus ellipticus CBS 707.79]|uniref:RING-type E3 ubiquitin transferase n=1 Tax=Aspergillus ellipticus CBS 707.79 TaxID=1448320 RepID=A0A319D659_9EURO|nr:hypothetical protein BO71DRAFT_12931 [Aspergillus ellipticus CBS 707.79]